MSRTPRPEYSVIVANVGTVYTGPYRRAASEYRAWIAVSKRPGGRASGECVTLCDASGEPVREYAPPVKLPTVAELAGLVKAIKRAGIEDDWRAFEDDDVPGVCLTIGVNCRTGEWSYQTGDNSYMGAAYHFPTWGVGYIYRRSNARDVARDILADIRDNLAD